MSQLLLFLVFLFRCLKSIENSDLVSGSNVFGHNLSKALSTDSSTNVWISPFCITSCFALLYAGSNSNTKTEIANVLGYPSNVDAAQVTQQFFILQSLIHDTYNGMKKYHYSNKASLIGIANKIYSSKSLTLKPAYISALNDGQQSFIDYDFDFAANNASKIINHWVKQNTNGLIESIIDENEDISSWHLAAINAIYLNGTFSKQFHSEMTSFSPFYNHAGRKTFIQKVHLMHQFGYFDYYTDGNHQFLKFSFSDFDDLFVLFALPMKADADLVTDVNVIRDVITNIESKYIALALPKLSITATYILNEALQDLGIKDAFGQNNGADFSGISDEELFIDTVIHKTMIEMDENGLVAAAVTLINLVETAMIITTRPTPILFKADHPFQLFIIDGEHDNLILFMGQVNDPGYWHDVGDTPYDESSDSVWTNYDLIGDSGNVSDANDEFNIVSLVVVIAAVLVVVFAVLIWCFLSRRQKKEVYIDGQKVSSRNFVAVELPEEKNKNTSNNPPVEVTKNDGIELAESPPNTLR